MKFEDAVKIVQKNGYHLVRKTDKKQVSESKEKEMTPEEKLAEAMAQYKKVITMQKGARKVVPPGVNAEYGYLLVKAGQKEEGMTLLKEEIALYPESEKFISRIIKQLEK